MSPDSKNETIKDEVEDIREAINGDDKIPIATFIQLRDTLDARSKIKDAVSQGKYAKGTPVPEDINVQLNAKKDEEGLLSFLNVADIPQEETDAVGESEDDESAEMSTKKDLSNPSGPDVLPFNWITYRLSSGEEHRRPIVMKKPTINTFLQFPLWFKLRRGFVRNLFASPN